MKTVYIEIPEESWGIIFLYDYDMTDWNDMWAIMRSFGMSYKGADEAIRILSTSNTGMTISNDDLRMSAIFISNATSKGQWLNTVVHETAHAAAAISSYYDKPCSGEDFAYLSGFIFQKIMEEVADIR